ncbi:MAG: biopolymer transporter ExbD [Bacteroidetes bacterium]|nr:biopolymer transporter ExbD [Bacteroidota bacterium]
MKFETKLKTVSSFNVGALVNVVMLLLMFFFMTSNFLLQPGVSVNIYRTIIDDKKDLPKALMIIDERGKMYLGMDEVNFSNLANKVSALKQNVQNNFTIRADKSVKIGLIARLVETLKTAGIKKINLQTDSLTF